jgi:hypothetical protein
MFSLLIVLPLHAPCSSVVVGVDCAYIVHRLDLPVPV